MAEITATDIKLTDEERATLLAARRVADAILDQLREARGGSLTSGRRPPRGPGRPGRDLDWLEANLQAIAVSCGQLTGDARPGRNR